MNLTNHFLVAMPGMQDSFFQRAVIYICRHDEDGAMGIIINAPTNLTIDKMLQTVDIESTYPLVYKEHLEATVLCGGPVSEDRGFVLHEPKDAYQSSTNITDSLSITTSKDILGALGTEAEPKKYIVALGYSGWTTGQLEGELARNSWLTVEADPSIIFETPMEDKWQKAIQILGIEPAHLSADMGCA